MAGWGKLSELVRLEWTASQEEGKNMKGLERLELELEAAGDDEQRLMEIYRQLMDLPMASDFPFVEPNDLEAIRAERTAGSRIMSKARSDSEWKDRFYGAWLGRCAGCMLGKPLEKEIFMKGDSDIPGWKNIYHWFEGADAWPVKGYTPLQSRAEETHGLSLVAGTIPVSGHVTTDDDIRYTLLGMQLLEEKGLTWDAWEVGLHWHRRLTYSQVCTAEKQAYMNFAASTSIWDTHEKPENWQQILHHVSHHLNPYREWIGAQIRADGLAFGAAARPQLAAELAWRDASFSHTKNGIYGEMFVAAMISAAFVTDQPRAIVQIGLSEIPRRSRLYQAIQDAVHIAETSSTSFELIERLWAAFGLYHPVHTINNAALVAAALVFAKGDFETAITTAVLGGWDTDCNGATVGSIMGAVYGASSLPRNWVEPLGATLYADMPGFHPISIKACSDRSFRLFWKLQGTSV